MRRLTISFYASPFVMARKYTVTKSTLSEPKAEDTEVKGGYQTSPSTVDRDVIPAAFRKVGMLVYTVATDETWILGPGITNGDWTLVPSVTGDVVGPASSVNERIPVFDGTTGKHLKQSLFSINGNALSIDDLLFISPVEKLSGDGNAVFISGGNGETAGGATEVVAGGCDAIGNGGNLTLGSGYVTDGDGGHTYIYASSGSGVNRIGGSVSLTAGNSTGTQPGANIEIKSGDNADDSAGNIILQPGIGSSASTDGSVLINRTSVDNRATRLAFIADDNNSISIKAPATATTHTLVLPGTQGASATVLTNDGSGNLSWTAGSSGVTGTGTTNTVPVWASTTSLTDSNNAPGDILLSGLDGVIGGWTTVRGGNASAGPGGDLELRAGTSSGANPGTRVLIAASDAGGTNQDGGNIELYPGYEDGTGVPGSVFIGGSICVVSPNGSNTLFVGGFPDNGVTSGASVKQLVPPVITTTGSTLERGSLQEIGVLVITDVVNLPNPNVSAGQTIDFFTPVASTFLLQSPAGNINSTLGTVGVIITSTNFEQFVAKCNGTNWYVARMNAV